MSLTPGVEIDLDNVRVPMTKERALGLQQELRMGFSAQGFQTRMHELEEKYSTESVEFKKTQQQLVLDVQKDIIPRYGFAASAEGVADMRLAVQAFKNHPEVNDNIDVINRLVGKTKSDHLELALALQPTDPEDPYHKFMKDTLQRKQLQQLQIQPLQRIQLQKSQQQLQQQRSRSLSPTYMPSSTQRSSSVPPTRSFKQPNITVQLDFNAINVPMTKVRALGLQNELKERFSEQMFRDQIFELQQLYDYESLEFKKAQHQLVLTTQAEIIPKYGFEANANGVADMRLAVQAFSSDPDVKDNMEIINRLIMKDSTMDQDQATLWHNVTFKKLTGGTKVMVANEFVSNMVQNVRLKPGKFGTVQKIHQRGNALVKFDGHKEALWIRKQDFDKLKVQEEQDVKELAAILKKEEQDAKSVLKKTFEQEVKPDANPSNMEQNWRIVSLKRKVEPIRSRHVNIAEGYWIVTGGSTSKGILVRLGEAFDSKAHFELLATGAIVRALMKFGTRLHYEKITGEGPNCGWVSITSKGTNLMEPYEGEIPCF